ncbi:MAG: RluA family pseudouridine synthase [Gammaproteobacteria bacterium]|nr:RluA family pseudouridine synthase [Gammaproteobacteria bacterium]
MTTPEQKTPARFVTVDAESAGRRLDNFLLTELKGMPRARIYRMIRKGEVRVNKGRSKPTSRLATGDVVRIPPVHLNDESGVTPPGGKRVEWILERILHEDEVLIVLNKPSGLAVHGGSGISLGAIELLRAARPDCRFLELVHRLDRDTSGCLLIAKKRSALRNLHAQLREGQTEKIYTTLLCGQWGGNDSCREVALPLMTEHRKNGERHVRTGADGKPACTRFYPRERFASATLCEAELLTGRTHQIRVHAAAIRHPVAGDSRYGSDEDTPGGLHRLFLHASRIAFSHPLTDERVEHSAPLPEELTAVLATLRAGN